MHISHSWHQKNKPNLLKEQGHRVKRSNGPLGNPSTHGIEVTLAPNPLGLCNPKHIVGYNVLSSKIIIATWYFDGNLLTSPVLFVV